MLWMMRETRDVGSKARHLDSEMLISTFAGSLISGMKIKRGDRMGCIGECTYVDGASLFAVSCFEHNTLALQVLRKCEHPFSCCGGAKDFCVPLPPRSPLQKKRRTNAKNQEYLGFRLYQAQ